MVKSYEETLLDQNALNQGGLVFSNKVNSWHRSKIFFFIFMSILAFYQAIRW